MWLPDESYLIAKKPLPLTGRACVASIYSTQNRRTGRRIIVRDAGQVVFDTHECYDLSNANNKLERWCMAQIVCVHCGTPGSEEDEWAQEAQTGYPICGPCARKASIPVPQVIPDAPPMRELGAMVASSSMNECPF